MQWLVSCNTDPLLASIFYYDIIWSARRGLVNSLYPTCSGHRKSVANYICRCHGNNDIHKLNALLTQKAPFAPSCRQPLAAIPEFTSTKIGEVWIQVREAHTTDLCHRRYKSLFFQEVSDRSALICYKCRDQ